MESPQIRQFASDNYAGICPEAWEFMQRANSGHAAAYGNDRWTEQASDLLRDVFEIDCEVFFTFNGTAANSLSLASLCRSYHSVIAHQLAHIETDECGGPEFFSNGTKVLVVPGDDGKVHPDQVKHTVKRRTDVHYPKPRVVSVTQSTEVGTIYTVDQLDAIRETARRCNLHVHMDGARFANALVSLDVAPKEITWKVGVDVLCLGGTKNGMAVGDCVIFFRKELADEFEYRCKQAGQLASKMRFLSAPWVGLLTNDVWLRNARHANELAQRLGTMLQELDGVEIMFPVEANAVFAVLPTPMENGLRALGWQFYNFIGAGGSRFMCSWDMTMDDVDRFVADCRRFINPDNVADP
jgi:threonine aldolase